MASKSLKVTRKRLMAVVYTHVGDEQSLESKIVQWCHGRAGAVVPREGRGQGCHGRAGAVVPREGGAEQRLQAYELTAE